MAGIDPDTSEEILAAATRIRAAANDIKWASINNKNTLEAHERWMDGWLRRFQDTMTKASSDTPAPRVIPAFTPGGMDDDIPF